MNKHNPAAINARSRKADMYAEVERLRALLDAQESELAMLRESNARLTQRIDNAVTSYRALRAERDALKAKSEEQAQVDGDIKEVARRCALLLKRSTRVEGGRVMQHIDGEWTPVPQRVVKFAAS